MRVSPHLTAKAIAARAAREPVENALAVTGGAGYFRAPHLARSLRDILAGQFHPLPEKKQHLIPGRFSLELEPKLWYEGVRKWG